MRVLRLEKDGNGVFMGMFAPVDEAIRLAVEKRGVETWPELQEWDGTLSPYRHPGPDTDVPGWQELSIADWDKARLFYCGFHSREQMLAWFDSEAVRSAMNEVGIELIEFEVPDDYVMTGTAQIMFRKEKATEIARGPVPTLVH